MIPSTHVARMRTLSAVSLFASIGTLLCCALPSLFVFLGFGAAVASVVSSVPSLVTLSRHKVWVFAGAGVLIAAGFAYRQWLAPRLRAHQLACTPDDPRCRTLDRMSGMLLWLSGGLYVAAACVAYGLPLILSWLDS